MLKQPTQTIDWPEYPKWRSVTASEFIKFLQGKEVKREQSRYVHDKSGLRLDLNTGESVAIESNWQFGYYSDVDGEPPTFYISEKP